MRKSGLSDDFKEVMSHWASTVVIAAVREGDRTYGTTATSFMPVSADPPTVAVALGPGAQVVPFLEPGSQCHVSLLNQEQGGVASAFADPFPVGPSPFPDPERPVVGGAVAALACVVTHVHPAPAGSRIVVAAVEDAVVGEGEPLLYYRRGYSAVARR